MIANVPTPQTARSLAAASLSFAAILLAIVVPVLLDFGYGRFDLEVWFWSFVACCLAGVLGWVDRRSPRTGACLLAVLFYAVIALYFVKSDIVSLGVLVACLTLSLLPIQSTFRIGAVVFALIFVATSLITVDGGLFQSVTEAKPKVDRSSTSRASAKLPPVVHIVLDELASLSRMPKFQPLIDLNKELERDYLSRGFTVFPSTRSTSGSSAIALSEMVGPSGRRYKSEEALASKTKGAMFQVPVNDYFARLRQQGYKISVIQSSHLSYCSEKVDRCSTYKRAEFIDTALRYTKPLAERLRVAGAVLHARASSRDGNWGISLYRYAIEGLDDLGVPGLATRAVRDDKIWSPARIALRVLDHMDAHFVTPQSGHAYFVHLLLPHFPFVLDRKCNLKPPSEWRWPLWAQAPAGARSTLSDIYVAYGEQLRCTHSRMMRLIDAMKQSEMGSEIVFIVHGDHGPRIHSKVGHLDTTSQSEALLSDGLDTFFAVKAPRLPPGIVDRFELLQVRFREIIESQILTTKGP